RRRHTRFSRDWSSDVCSSDLELRFDAGAAGVAHSRARTFVFEQRDNRPREPALVVRLDEQARLALDDRLVDAPGARGDHGTPAEIGRAACRDRWCTAVDAG